MFRRKKNSVVGLGVALLLSYLIGAIGLNYHHVFEHSHDHSHVHSAENESDACHRAIFHGDLSLGCEHEEHIHSSEADCELCDAIVNREEAEVVEPRFIQGNSAVFHSKTILSELVLPSVFRNAKPRGPPSV